MYDMKVITQIFLDVTTCEGYISIRLVLYAYNGGELKN